MPLFCYSKNRVIKIYFVIFIFISLKLSSNFREYLLFGAHIVILCSCCYIEENQNFKNLKRITKGHQQKQTKFSIIDYLSSTKRKSTVVVCIYK